MAVTNPCCCCKLQLGATIVAILNIVGSLAMLIWYTLQLLLLFGVAILFVKTVDESDAKTKGAVATIGVFILIVAIIFVIQAVVFLVASIFLFIGAQKRNIYKCRIWLVLALLSLVFSFISKCSTILFRQPRYEATASDDDDDGNNHEPKTVFEEILEFVIFFVIVGYQIWVVYAFMEEVRAEQRAGIGTGTTPAVHYVPKATTGENPPPYYGQPAYTPYGPAGPVPQPGPPPPGPAAGFYPLVPAQDATLPYKSAPTYE